jgi:hypothetical protein
MPEPPSDEDTEAFPAGGGHEDYGFPDAPVEQSNVFLGGSAHQSGPPPAMIAG